MSVQRVTWFELEPTGTAWTEDARPSHRKSCSGIDCPIGDWLCGAQEEEDE